MRLLPCLLLLVLAAALPASGAMIRPGLLHDPAVYSPPSVVQHAVSVGLVPLWARLKVGW